MPALPARPAAARRLIEDVDAPPSLAELAAAAGLSPHHVHRVFRSVAGVTRRHYAAAHRTRRVREGLRTCGTVTEAIYDAGFNAGSRFYEASDGMLGMTPGGYRADGAGAEIRFAVGACSLGAILVAQADRGICALLLGDDPEAQDPEAQDRASDQPSGKLTSA